MNRLGPRRMDRLLHLWSFFFFFFFFFYSLVRFTGFSYRVSRRKALPVIAYPSAGRTGGRIRRSAGDGDDPPISSRLSFFFSVVCVEIVLKKKGKAFSMETALKYEHRKKRTFRRLVRTWNGSHCTSFFFWGFCSFFLWWEGQNRNNAQRTQLEETVAHPLINGPV